VSFRFPAGGPCAKKVAANTKNIQRELRFAAGDRVACLAAGPDGEAWPRRWSSGTVKELWYQPKGAPQGGAVPYAVELDSVDGGSGSGSNASSGQAQAAPKIVLVHRDDHMYVRSLELQPAGECGSGAGLPRFTERESEDAGYIERVDQQTLRVRKVTAAPAWSDSDEEG
jgi:hypothetical protein